MNDSYRIIDANLNRAREALRVAEDYARFVLDDGRLSALAKSLRSALQQAVGGLDAARLLAARDTVADVGTAITSETEGRRAGEADVALAACKRVQEALRAVEEYAKIVEPAAAPAFERLRYDSYVFEQVLCGRGQLRRRFAAARLYVLLTSELCRLDPLVCAHAAIAGGADCIQLREKAMDDGAMLELARRLRGITADAGVLLIVNDRPDIAALVGADGVHVGQGDLPASAARRIVGGDKLVGVSTHSLQQARAASADDACDYIGVGPMFPTATKAAEPVRGPGLMREIAAADLGIPHVAIGGIRADNAAELARAGAERIAVCGAVIASDDPAVATAELRRNFLAELNAGGR